MRLENQRTVQMKPLLMLPLLFFVACSDDNSPQTEMDAGVDSRA